MKFLCGNCKAKYQIADEKAAGRTLRMKCRRCDHDILIQGQQGSVMPPPNVGGSTVSLPPRPPPGPGRGAPPPPVPGGATPPPAPLPAVPSALGAGFRRGLAAPSAAAQRPVALDQWHVSIHDVPVGPMSREEIGRKIATGAVAQGSLCWREGMDDWRPVAEVPELAPLFGRGSAVAALPSRPAPVGGRMGAGAPLSSEEYDEEFGEPTRVAEMPAGMPAFGTPPPQAMPGLMPQVAPSAPPEPRRTQMSPWLLVAIGMSLSFALLGVPLIFGKLMSDDAPAPLAQAPVGPAAPLAPQLEVTEPEPSAEQVQLEEMNFDVEAAPTQAKHRTHSGSTKKPSTAAKTGGKQLSAAEQALLARMGGGGGTGPASLGGGSSRSSKSGSSGGGPLKASQLRAVVSKNKPALQRCYETALRATGGTDTVKITVGLTVGLSGTVTKVKARGNGVGDLNRCIERSVKRWRFPSASDRTEFEFPVVFQPGA